MHISIHWRPAHAAASTLAVEGGPESEGEMHISHAEVSAGLPQYCRSISALRQNCARQQCSRRHRAALAQKNDIMGKKRPPEVICRFLTLE
jgi:hypothetical protein